MEGFTSIFFYVKKSLKPWTSSKPTNFFEKKLDKKLYLLHTVQILSFSRWCSVVVHLQRPFHVIVWLQNEVLHKSSLLTFFQESK